MCFQTHGNMCGSLSQVFYFYCPYPSHVFSILTKMKFSYFFLGLKSCHGILLSIFCWVIGAFSLFHFNYQRFFFPYRRQESHIIGDFFLEIRSVKFSLLVYPTSLLKYSLYFTLLLLFSQLFHQVLPHQKMKLLIIRNVHIKIQFCVFLSLNKFF